jgi:hypothetical protein
MENAAELDNLTEKVQVTIDLIPHTPPPTSSSDRTWHYVESKGIFSILFKKPWMVPFLLVFLFLYFGLPNVVLFFVFHPSDIRISEAFMCVLLGPISLLFSQAEFHFRTDLSKFQSLYENRPSSLSSSTSPKATTSNMTLRHKVRIGFVYLILCYPLVPGIFRAMNHESFAGASWVGIFITVWNLVFGGLYFFLIAYAMCKSPLICCFQPTLNSFFFFFFATGSLKRLIQVINSTAAKSAAGRITNLEELDSWNDDFLNFQNILENISKGIQFPIVSICIVVLFFTATLVVITLKADSILFPEWIQMVKTSLFFFFSSWIDIGKKR